MRSPGRVSLALVLSATMPLVSGAQAPPAGAGSPLTLRTTCDARGEVPVMRVQVANTTDRATGVVLGFIAADGTSHVVNAIHAVAIRPATGADEVYVYVNPKFALTDGPPWIVSLAPGATHEVALPLRDFISALNYSSLDPAVAGGARLVLEARPAAGTPTPVWTGTIETPIGPCVP